MLDTLWLETKQLVHLWKPLWKQTVAVDLNKLPVGVPANRQACTVKNLKLQLLLSDKRVTT